MVAVFIEFIPSTIGFFPDDHFPIVGAGSQDVAVHGMGPSHLPNWTFMTAKTEKCTQITILLLQSSNLDKAFLNMINMVPTSKAIAIGP